MPRLGSFPDLQLNMSALRSVRALRPLRALKRVPGMPVLVNSMLQSFPPLVTVLGITFFFFLVLGIVGMNMFQGVRRRRHALQNGPPRQTRLRASPPACTLGHVCLGPCAGASLPMRRFGSPRASTRSTRTQGRQQCGLRRGGRV